jgi:thiamine-monophosphate kinase
LAVTPTVGSLGEFGLIAALTARLPQHAGVLVGPGDDAAVLSSPDGRVVACTDVLVQDRHFRLLARHGAAVGRKAAAANLADVAAMGAVPTALLWGLVAPAELDAQWLLDVATGLAVEAAETGAAVVGGDLAAGPLVVLAVSALGDLQGRAPVRRAGARAGDVVAACGRLGDSAAGFALLEAGLGVRHPELVDAHRCPRPPYAAGPRAADAGATAMIDVSDGLLADLGHLAAASNVHIDLATDALPPDDRVRAAAADLGVDPADWVFSGGEDHALVATFPPGTSLPPGWRGIGWVHAGEPGVTVDGAPRPGRAGWDHYREQR